MKIIAIALIFAVSVAVLAARPVQAGLIEGRRAFDLHRYNEAYREFRPLADAGDPEAQFMIAWMLHNSQGVGINTNRFLNNQWMASDPEVMRNRAEAAKLLESAMMVLRSQARGGDPDSQFLLAMHNYEYVGYSAAEKILRGLEYYYAAAKSGHKRSQRALLGTLVGKFTHNFGHGDFARLELEKLEREKTAEYFRERISGTNNSGPKSTVQAVFWTIVAADQYKTNLRFLIPAKVRRMLLNDRERVIVDGLVEMWRDGTILAWARDAVGSPEKTLAEVADINFSPYDKAWYLFTRDWEVAAAKALQPLAAAGDLNSQALLGFIYEISYGNILDRATTNPYFTTSHADAWVLIYRMYLAAARQGNKFGKEKLVDALLGIEPGTKGERRFERAYRHYVTEGTAQFIYDDAIRIEKLESVQAAFRAEIWFRVAALGGLAAAQERLRVKPVGELKYTSPDQADKVADDVAKEWTVGELKAWVLEVMTSE